MTRPRLPWWAHSEPYSKPFSLLFIVLAIAWALLAGYSVTKIAQTILYILLGLAFIWGLTALLAGIGRVLERMSRSR